MLKSQPFHGEARTADDRGHHSPNPAGSRARGAQAYPRERPYKPETATQTQAPMEKIRTHPHSNAGALCGRTREQEDTNVNYTHTQFRYCLWDDPPSRSGRQEHPLPPAIGFFLSGMGWETVWFTYKHLISPVYFFQYKSFPHLQTPPSSPPHKPSPSPPHRDPICNLAKEGPPHSPPSSQNPFSPSRLGEWPLIKQGHTPLPPAPTPNQPPPSPLQGMDPDSPHDCSHSEVLICKPWPC